MRFTKVFAPVFAGLVMTGMPLLGNANVAQQYQESCAACHETGALNSPQTGDTATWSRLKADKGMKTLVNAVKNGGKQMPAGGLCSNCSDADYAALIEYMSK